MKRLFTALLGVMVLMFGVSFTARAANVPSEPQVLVEQAQITLSDFQKAPEMGWYRSALKDAKGVMVVPGLIKAGLIFGGSGGKGVYFTKDDRSQLCKGPAFYNMGSVTFGLQAGGQKSELVILAMTDSAVKAMLAPQFKLGADASVAVGPVGVGTAGQATLPAAAFIVFSRNRGLFAGVTVEGAIVTVDRDFNRAYYGRRVDTTDILVTDSASGAGGLCALIERPFRRTD